MFRRWIIICLALSVFTVSAQDTPSIPVGLSDPYLMFIPVGWQTRSNNPYGFVTVSNPDISMNILDPTRFEQYIPYNPDTSARQLLIDYRRFFYAQSIDRNRIVLETIGENTVAIYPDPDQPARATYIVELTNQHFALIEAQAIDGQYDTEQARVHTILETLSVSLTGEIRTETLYETRLLPSKAYTLTMPDDWFIEASLAAGQIFLVGDGLETIVLAPNTISSYFEFPPDVNLVDLARIIEAELFDIDLTNIEVARSQIGDRLILSYSFRNLMNNTDTQVALVQLPDGDVAYFRTTTLQDELTILLGDRLRRITLSIRPVTRNNDLLEDDINARIIPNSGQWRITPRDMMRLVCDGDPVEQLIPLSNDLRQLFGDFDTILTDPDGGALTLAGDGIANLFQTGTLTRDDAPYFQIIERGAGYTLTPHSEDVMIGRLNLIETLDDGRDCRFGMSLTLRYID